jgi:hypothetical protein
MGFQERWQSRQEELAAQGEARDAKAAQDRDAQTQSLRQPVLDRAREAYERGDGWFETEIEQRTAGNLTPYGGTGQDWGVPAAIQTGTDDPAAPRAPRGDLLSQIEDVGWTLHTAQYLYVQLGEESRDKWLSSGQRVAIRGKIVGMYLFRRA